MKIINNENLLPCPSGEMESKRINRKSNLRGLFSKIILTVLFFISISIANFFEQTAQNAFGSTLGTIDRAENLMQDEEAASKTDSTLNKDIASPDSTKMKDKLEAPAIEIEPKPDDFIPYDKEPGIDLVRLSGLVKYPESARKENIQGIVIVRLLVNTEGKVTKTFIEHSDNETLNSAAEDAVREYGDLSPAIVKGEPITCWVSIPVRFRLR